MKFLNLFRGLTKAYYFRQLFFGILMGALLFYIDNISNSPKSGLLLFIIINTLLYPYARFAYESVIDFIMGNNVFFFNAILFLIWKIFTMILCWSFAIFIAPVGLLFIYLYQRKSDD
ncbi:hypothetical protein ACOL3I_08420 [Aliarcobacter butzleri]